MSAPRVRHRADTGFEMKCSDCRDYWPLDLEFWSPEAGMVRCRACLLDRRAQLERKRARSRLVRLMTPEQVARKRLMDNDRKKREREDPVRGDRLRAREREAQQRFYEKHRSDYLERRRNYYERTVGHPPTPGIGRPRVDTEKAA